MHTWRMLLLRAAVASGVGVTTMEEHDLMSEGAELKRRLVAAEEQAAAAWAVAGACQKAIEELRQGFAEDISITKAEATAAIKAASGTFQVKP